MPAGSNYFGGAPNAFAGGMEFSAAQRQRRAQENALNALIERFGPEAANPAALATLQGVDQRQQMFPHQLGAAERSTAAHEANVQEHGDVAGDPAAVATDAAMSTRLRSTMLNAARYLQATKKRGGDVTEAFGRVVPILSALNLPAEQIQGLQQQILTNPDSLDELVAMLSGEGSVRAMGSPVRVYDDDTGRARLMIPMADGSMQLVEGVTPADTVLAEGRLAQGRERLGQGWARLSWDQVKAMLPSAQPGVQYWMDPSGRVVADVVPGAPQEREAEARTQEQSANDRKFVQSYGAVTDHAAVVQRGVERALPYFQGAGSGVILQSLRRGGALIPGTPAHEARSALEEIKNNIGIDELQRMRQSSPTGGAMGNVSDRDIALLTGALGRLEVEDDPERMAENLEFIATTYQRILAAAEQDATAAQRRMQEREQRGRYGPPVPARPAAQESLDDLLNHYAPR